jgi:hypothetical protein
MIWSNSCPINRQWGNRPNILFILPWFIVYTVILLKNEKKKTPRMASTCTTFIQYKTQVSMCYYMTWNNIRLIEMNT